jgi:hypothetical protein
LAMSRPIVVTSDTDASLSGVSTPPLWHIDAVGGRPPHQISAILTLVLSYGVRGNFTPSQPKNGPPKRASVARVLLIGDGPAMARTDPLLKEISGGSCGNSRALSEGPKLQVPLSGEGKTDAGRTHEDASSVAFVVAYVRPRCRHTLCGAGRCARSV